MRATHAFGFTSSHRYATMAFGCLTFFAWFRAALGICTAGRLRSTQMWNCPKCDETLRNMFAVCWQCGTDRDGNEDPAFAPESVVGDVLLEQEEMQLPRRWQFSLRRLFLLLTCTAIIAGLIRGIPEAAELAIAGIVAANLLGLIAGWMITYVLRFPNDGSLTWDNEENALPSSADEDT